MKTKLITALACLALASCSFPGPDGSEVRATPGYWLGVGPDTEGARSGVLVETLSPAPSVVSEK